MFVVQFVVHCMTLYKVYLVLLAHAEYAHIESVSTIERHDSIIQLNSDNFLSAQDVED